MREERNISDDSTVATLAVVSGDSARLPHLLQVNRTLEQVYLALLGTQIRE